jgi:hypothetical protein
MADTNIAGLFGITPQAYNQQQQQLINAEAQNFASLDPYQQVTAGSYGAGRQLGRGIVGALGGQDPQLQKITAINALSKQIDFSNPESIMQGANAISQIDPTTAMGLAQRAQTLAKSMADAGKITEETKKINIENLSKQGQVEQLMQQFKMSQTEALAVASNPDLLKSYLTPKSAQVIDLLKTGKYLPESVMAWQNGGKLEPIDKFTKPTADFAAKAVELGFGQKNNFGDYAPEQIAQINTALFNEDIKKKQAGAMAVKIPLGDVLEKVYLSKDREEAAKNWSKAGEAYTVTVPLIEKLNTVQNTVSNAYTGAGANAKLAVSKGLSAVGVKISDRATDTEIAEAISAQVVQQIAKVFPGSQSNKELEQLLKSKFNVNQELPTIIRLIGQIRDEMLSQKVTYEQGAKLPDSERTSFNAHLAQGKNYQAIQQYRALEDKYRSGKITDPEREQAKALKQQLGL